MPAKRALALLVVLAGVPALADAPVFLIDPTELPFDLGPGAPLNNPANRHNLPTAAGNSASNPGNSSALAENAPGARANRPGGGRAIILDDGEAVGYYTRNGGTLNLFDSAGRRVAYRPGGGTKSLFDTDGQWCGTVAATDGGGMAFGLTESCVLRLIGR